MANLISSTSVNVGVWGLFSIILLSARCFCGPNMGESFATYLYPEMVRGMGASPQSLPLLTSRSPPCQRNLCQKKGVTCTCRQLFKSQDSQGYPKQRGRGSGATCWLFISLKSKEDCKSHLHVAPTELLVKHFPWAPANYGGEFKRRPSGRHGER